MRTKSRVIALAAVTCVLSGSAAVQGGSGPSCGKFSAFLELDQIETVDTGAAGPSAGDRRIGRYQLLDEAGHPLGAMEFVSTVLLPRSDGATTLRAEIYHTYADGVLAATILYELPDVMDTERGPTEDLVEIVTGGSGVFAHASGTIHARSEEDGRRRLNYDLVCD